MAELKVSLAFDNIRKDVAKLVTPGSDLLAFLEAARNLASEHLALVPGLTAAEGQGLVRVSAEIGDLTAGDDQDDESTLSGFVRINVTLPVPDEYAYNHRAESSAVYQYVRAWALGMSGVFLSLPNNGADLITAMGMQSPGTSIKLGSSVRVFG